MQKNSHTAKKARNGMQNTIRKKSGENANDQGKINDEK